MELVQRKSGNGVEWVVMGALENAGSGKTDARSLDCAKSFAGANDSASLGMTEAGNEFVIPGILACVDPDEK